jgi:hypothetical protein
MEDKSWIITDQIHGPLGTVLTPATAVARVKDYQFLSGLDCGEPMARNPPPVTETVSVPASMELNLFFRKNQCLLDFHLCLLTHMPGVRCEEFRGLNQRTSISTRLRVNQNLDKDGEKLLSPRDRRYFVGMGAGAAGFFKSFPLPPEPEFAVMPVSLPQLSPGSGFASIGRFDSKN